MKINKSESVSELEKEEVVQTEHVSIPDEVVAEMGVFEPEEVSELVEANETELVEASGADLDSKPEENSELIKANETEEASKQQENFQQKPRQENVSLWRRFKKFMTPSCRRQYKDKKKNQGQM